MPYPASKKLAILGKVLKEGESVSKVCRQAGIARKTFYQWKKKYQQAPNRIKREALELNYPSGRSHPKNKRHQFEDKVISFVVRYPSWGSRKIVANLGKVGHRISNHAVYELLKDFNLETKERRQEFSSLYQTFAKIRKVYRLASLRFTPEARKRIIEEVVIGDRSVAEVCRQYRLSRKAFYKWLNRYKEAGAMGENLLLAMKDNYPRAETHPRGTSQKIVDKILAIVVAHPEYSTHKIGQMLAEIGNHGVQNVLQRFNLNTYENRLTFAETYAPKPVFRPTAAFWDRLKLVWEKFIPSLAAAPPPGWKKVKGLLRSAALGTLLTSGFGFVSYRWLLMLSRFPPGTRIGLFFATIALTVGSFFFLYSMKYYLTLALVLSSSRETPSGQDLFEREKRGNSWLPKIFNFNGRPGLLNNHQKNGNGRNGLNNDVQDVKLKRFPFVSIHLPFYNEKKVAKRILDACASIDYPHFEIIVCDDSTDETVEIVQTYARKHNSKLRRQGRKGPFIEVLHRPNREGFKGGALAYAVRQMDPRTEFVVVFDADFVPYPDTLLQFLKYFKASNHGSEDYTKNNVAVVGGYQWHVLNKSENWITRGVRTEYAGSYVIERPGQELTGALKQISGSVYMIRADVLKEIGWGTSITEDFQLTLKLYEKGYKVVYTPYVQAPAECVSTLKRLIRQRMRWAEGHGNNVRKMFFRLMKSPNLNLMEKLEVLYLSPYYLQAAFFLVGTLCWLISETVFKARLPFWTAIWGWSLVLTNLFALPLMNSVGLFLEEAEERDYLGILSFVVLSYIVVPFQAYASIKGFLEKEEGGWFRTPKTGRITDIFARGRFYRWISRILPWRFSMAGSMSGVRLAPVAAPPDLAPYLALATANNRFNRFFISPRETRLIGRVSLAILLVFSTILLSLAPAAPYLMKPEQTQAKDFGVLAKPDEEVDEREIVHQEEGGKMPVGTEVSTYYDPGSSTSSSTSDEKVLKKDFRSNEEPELVFHFAEENPPSLRLRGARERQGLIDRLLNLFKVQAFSNDEIKARLFDNSGREVTTELEVSRESEGDVKVKVPASSSFKPGVFKLKVELVDDGKTYTQEQDFTWGVLAINTNKSIYVPYPYEKGEFWMTVLDDRGRTVCDAEVELKIFSADSSTAGETSEVSGDLTSEVKEAVIAEFSTEDGSIKKSDECGPDNFTYTPDYKAEFEIGEEIGVYKMSMAATTPDGTREIEDSFEVVESRDFDVERIGPTRIYPPASYQMTFRIKVNQGFSGEIVEYVPNSFEILNQESGIRNQVSTSGESVSATPGVSGADKSIVWAVDWQAGETHELVYEFDAPDKSPMFYLLGPLEFRDSPSMNSGPPRFSEARRWQIAADAPGPEISTPSVIYQSTVSTATAYGNSRRIFRDSNSNYLAVYVDSDNDVRVSYINDGNSAWVQYGTVIDNNAANVAAALDSSGNLHIALADLTDASLVYYIKVTVSRTSGVIQSSGWTISSRVGLETTSRNIKIARPSVTVDTNNNLPAVAWAVYKSLGAPPVVGYVRFSRCRVGGDCTASTGWVGANTDNGTSGLIVDNVTPDFDEGMHPVLVQMPDNTGGSYTYDNALYIWYTRVTTNNDLRYARATWDSANSKWSVWTDVGLEASVVDTRELDLSAVRDATNFRLVVTYTGTGPATNVFYRATDATGEPKTQIDPSSTNYIQTTLSSDDGGAYYYLIGADTANAQIIYKRCTVSGPTWSSQFILDAGDVNADNSNAYPSASVDDAGGYVHVIFKTATASPYRVEYGGIGAPQDPSALIQFENDHETVISVGADTLSGVTDNIWLDFGVSSPSKGDVLIPKVEVEDINTSFDNTASATGDNVIYDAEDPDDVRSTCIAYDDLNDQMVMWGGYMGNSTKANINDTWVLSLKQGRRSQWKKLTTSGTKPQANRAHVCVYDSLNDRLVVYGGWNGSAYLTTPWALTLPASGTPTWSQLTAVTGPSSGQQVQAMAVYDPSPSRMIVYGGNNGVTYIDAVYELTLPSSGSPTWTNLGLTTGPSATGQGREAAAAVYDSDSDRMVMYGGTMTGNVDVNEVWSLNLAAGSEAWTQISPTGDAGARSGDQGTLQPDYSGTDDRMIIFAGWQTAYTSDVWELTLPESGTSVWTDKTPTDDYRPQFRGYGGPQGIYDPLNNRALFFGGYDGTYFSNEVIAFDLPTSGSFEYKVINDIRYLRGRDASSMVFDSANNQVVMFAGASRGIPTYVYHVTETWKMNTSGTPVWRDVGADMGPIIREGPSMVYDPLNQRAVACLGLSVERVMNDCWKLSLPSSGRFEWTNLNPSGTRPSRRWAAAEVYDDLNDRMVIFGGRTGSTTETNDVHFLSLPSGGGSSAWTQPTIDGTPPAACWQPTGVYDPDDDLMVVFGGTNDTLYYNDVFTLTLPASGNPTWSGPLSCGTAPAGRRGHEAVWEKDYTGSDDRMVVFGGYDGTNHYNDVWQLAFPAAGGCTWSQLSPSGNIPQSRRSISSAYDSVNNRMIIFGGRRANEPFFDDTWALSLGASPAWTRLDPRVAVPASVPITGLTQNVSYHWQGWGTADMGDASKVSYGGNSDTVPADADFVVIPEKLLVFLFLGPLLPKLIKRFRKKRRIKFKLRSK